MQAPLGGARAVTSDERASFLRFVNICQIFVATIRSPGDLGGLDRLFEFDTLSLESDERTMVHSILSAVLLKLACAGSTPRQLRQRITASLCVLADGRWPTGGSHPAIGLASVRVDRALTIIARRFGEHSLTLTIVARELRVSPFHLTRLLKKHTGHGFRKHLTDCRLGQAKALLTTTLLSVKEITASIGYGHVSDFDRAFKRRFGMTPGQYRANATRAEAKRL
jgi:AraC-like DNA-binding protein